jgi:zinc protease
MLKAVDDDAKTNNYWIRKIGQLRDYGVDAHTDYKKVVEAQTPEAIKAFMQEFLKLGNRAEVVMLPEE